MSLGAESACDLRQDLRARDRELADPLIS